MQQTPQPPPQGYGPPGYGPQGGMPMQGGPPAAPNPAQQPAIIMFVCAAAILIGMVTKGWASAGEGGMSINAGLFSIEGCDGDGDCDSLDWDKAAKRLDIPGDVDAFRIVGMLAGFAALAGAAFAGFMALQRTPNKIPIKPLQIVFGIASGTLTYFAVRLWMSDKDVNFGPSYSMFVTVIGLAAAGFVLRKQLAPLAASGMGAMPQQMPMGYPGPGQPMPMQGMPGQPMPGQPMAPPPPPPVPQAPSACPRCGGQNLQFAAQYQRYFCTSCQQYV